MESNRVINLIKREHTRNIQGEYDLIALQLVLDVWSESGLPNRLKILLPGELQLDMTLLKKCVKLIEYIQTGV